MSSQKLNDLIEAAVAGDILPSDAAPTSTALPWPVVLMTGLGAWLAVIPLVAVLFITLGSPLERGSLTYTVGVLILGTALFLLRSRHTPEFVEQLGFPALLVAGVLLAFGFYRDLSTVLASAALMLVILGAAWAVPQLWLRTLLGALACAAFAMMFGEDRLFWRGNWQNGLYCAALVWTATVAWADARPVSGTTAEEAMALDAIASGWAAMLLLGLAYSAGQSFMIGVLAEPFQVAVDFSDAPLSRILSLLLAVAGAAWLAWHWPACRMPRMLLAALLLLALCWMMPPLGAALLVLAICATSARPLLATTAAVAAAWIVGCFYYQLALPLTTKALLMAASGAAFGLIGWPSRPRGLRSAAQPGQIPKLMALTLLAVLVVVNGGIWQKEQLIRNGRTVFIALAPVDPRSMIQGDYMRLNFSSPDLNVVGRHVKVVAAIDDRGIAVIRRAASEGPPATNEILIELVNTQSGLQPASDAWYFKEGEGKRWDQAKYGEFRIDSNGHALLVNLRGANLEPL